MISPDFISLPILGFGKPFFTAGCDRKRSCPSEKPAVAITSPHVRERDPEVCELGHPRAHVSTVAPTDPTWNLRSVLACSASTVDSSTQVSGMPATHVLYAGHTGRTQNRSSHSIARKALQLALGEAWTLQE